MYNVQAYQDPSENDYYREDDDAEPANQHRNRRQQLSDERYGNNEEEDEIDESGVTDDGEEFDTHNNGNSIDEIPMAPRRRGQYGNRRRSNKGRCEAGGHRRRISRDPGS